MSDKTRAKRQRAHRRRQKMGLIAVTVYLDVDAAEPLIKRGILTAEDWADPHTRAEILGLRISKELNI